VSKILADVQAFMGDLGPIRYYESVPSGGRWFCGECAGIVKGLGELDRDDALTQMQHQPGCLYIIMPRLLLLVEAAERLVEGDPSFVYREDFEAYQALVAALGEDGE
jgi:hypothetical protein